MPTKKTMLLTRSVVTNPCLHREACEHMEAIAAALEIETQLVTPEEVATIRAGGEYVDQASCIQEEN